MHHIAYLDKIHWHFVSQCFSHVAWGMHEIITEVTASSYNLYHSCMYIPVNNSEIKYKGPITKKKTSTSTRTNIKIAQEHAKTPAKLLPNLKMSKFLAGLLHCQQNSLWSWKCCWAVKTWLHQVAQHVTREVWVGFPCTPLRSLWHHRNPCLGLRQVVYMHVMCSWSQLAAWISL